MLSVCKARLGMGAGPRHHRESHGCFGLGHPGVGHIRDFGDYDLQADPTPDRSKATSALVAHKSRIKALVYERISGLLPTQDYADQPATAPSPSQGQPSQSVRGTGSLEDEGPELGDVARPLLLSTPLVRPRKTNPFRSNIGPNAHHFRPIC